MSPILGQTCLLVSWVLLFILLVHVSVNITNGIRSWDFKQHATDIDDLLITNTSFLSIYYTKQFSSSNQFEPVERMLNHKPNLNHGSVQNGLVQWFPVQFGGSELDLTITKLQSASLHEHNFRVRDTRRMTSLLALRWLECSSELAWLNLHKGSNLSE